MREDKAFVEGTSPDLAYSLQFEMIKQMTTLSMAMLGFIVTLFGSILRDLQDVRQIWVALGAAGVAAFLCILMQIGVIGSLFERRPHRRLVAVFLYVILLLQGISVGSVVGAIQKSRSPAVAEAAIEPARDSQPTDQSASAQARTP